MGSRNSELVGQIINLLQEGQICLAAIHAYNNGISHLKLDKYVCNRIEVEFNSLVEQLNGRADD